jgi:hypothetical protein
MTPQAVVQPQNYGKPAFDHGVHNGISWHVTGDEEYRKPTAQHIVDFIRDNFFEPYTEGILD